MLGYLSSYIKIKKLYVLLVCIHIFLIFCKWYRLLTNRSRFSSSCAGSSFKEVVDLVWLSHIFVSSLEDLYLSSFHWKTPLPKLPSFVGTLSLFFPSHKIFKFSVTSSYCIFKSLWNIGKYLSILIYVCTFKDSDLIIKVVFYQI